MKNQSKMFFAKLLKNIYWATPLVIGVIYGIYIGVYYWQAKGFPVFPMERNDIISVSCTFLGVFVTVWVLLFALPKNEKAIRMLDRGKHFKIYSLINMFGMIFCVINIIVALFVECFVVNLCFLLLTVGELFNDGYYIYCMIKLFIKVNLEGESHQ